MTRVASLLDRIPNVFQPFSTVICLSTTLGASHGCFVVRYDLLHCRLVSGFGSSPDTAWYRTQIVFLTDRRIYFNISFRFDVTQRIRCKSFRNVHDIELIAERHLVHANVDSLLLVVDVETQMVICQIGYRRRTNRGFCSFLMQPLLVFSFTNSIGHLRSYSTQSC